jgi:hypothetical protein
MFRRRASTAIQTAATMTAANRSSANAALVRVLEQQWCDTLQRHDRFRDVRSESVELETHAYAIAVAL